MASSLNINHGHQLDSVNTPQVQIEDVYVNSLPTPAQRPTGIPNPPKPLPVPSIAYGLWITGETAFFVGCQYVPLSIYRISSRRLIERKGRRCLNVYCRDKFPDIPFHWSQPVRAVLPHTEGALFMLGRKRRCKITGERVEEIFVSEEQVRRVRDALHLGDQEPG